MNRRGISLAKLWLYDRSKEKKHSWLTHWEKYLSSIQNSSHKNPQLLQCLFFFIYKCYFSMQHILLLPWSSYLCLLVVLLADAISYLRVTQNVDWYNFWVSNWDRFYQARKHSISGIRNKFFLSLKMGRTGPEPSWVFPM